LKTISANWFLWSVALLTALRFCHFGPDIDAPHDWRQSDTAYYIRDFYQNGIDLLHPAVCWMGRSDTLALEFPLPEALVAAAYRVFGESIPLARLIFLCFFLGALYYFYQITALLFGRVRAQWATLIYLALPLSIFYSRAIQIDFAAVFAAHAMLYYYLLGLQERHWKHLFISGLYAVFVFLIKAPYAFCLFPAMLYWVMREKSISLTIRTGLYYVPATIAFALWQLHVNQINGAAPNLDYILHYRKMTQSASWYFGNLMQRLTPYTWWVLLQRGVLEVTGLGGIVFLFWGIYKRHEMPNLRLLMFWVLGLIAYILVFYNLNFVHNYYQIPLLAPVAILCSEGLQVAARYKPKFMIVLFGALAAANVVYTETAYFKVDAPLLEMARVIRENTPDSALVIVTYQNMDCRNPKILYPARRRGWSVEEAALNPELIRRLHEEEGADYWAYIGSDLPEQMHAFVDSLPSNTVWNLSGESGKVFIFDLGTK
jgi:hypothetical protein